MQSSSGLELQSNAQASRKHWYAVATRSRHEQSVARFLDRNGLETYVPLKRVWSSRVDRKKQIDVPALPGYIFIRCDLTPDVRADVKKGPGVVCLVSISQQPCRIPDDQIRSLRILLESREDFTVLHEWEPGQTVRIKSGPMKGATGSLSRFDTGQHRLVVKIEHVGLALSVNVHEADVELIAA